MRDRRKMKKLVFAVLLLLPLAVAGQDARIIRFPELQNRLDDRGEEILIFNFWATWCAPCVKEMPYFQKLEEKKLPGVKITLISLDFPEKIKAVNSFIRRKNITSEVFLLDEPDANSWINKVEEKWSGMIPATLLINAKSGERRFRSGELRDGELERLVDELR